MGRKVIALWLCLAMMLGMIVIIDVSMDFTMNVKGTTLYVNMTGSGGAYTNIQDAINASMNGDTIFVYNGTYEEQLAVDVSLNLIGENKETTFINGSGSGDVIVVSADWVNITGFTISRNETFSSTNGIKLDYVQNCNITNNDISNMSDAGIYIYYSDQNNIIGNELSNNQYGIELTIANGNKIIDNNASYNRDSNIYVGTSNENIFTGNNASYSRFGFHLHFTQGNLFSDNTMIEDGFYIHGRFIEYWINNNIESSNTVNGKPVYFWKNQTAGTVPLGAGQVILANCTNVTIKNQELTKASGGILLGFSWSNYIIGNNVSSHSYNGIRIYKSNSSNISGNYISDNEYFGIFVFLSHSNNITDNVIYSNTQYGINIRDSDHNKVVNNTIYWNNYAGIILDSSNVNNVTGNKIYSNNIAISIVYSTGNKLHENNMSGEGILIGSQFIDEWNTHEIDTSNTVNGRPVYYWKNRTGGIVPNGAGQIILAKCENVNITNQNISNGSYGILLGFSSFNNITNNNFSYNSYGMLLIDSNENNISSNFVSYNKYGIVLVASAKRNKIYNNSFIKNTDQANDDGEFNKWDSGYPSGGNYWSDYTGIDYYKGVDQDIPGSDGIGDTLYSIDFNSNDYYPLIQQYMPLENYSILKQGWNLISIPFIQIDQNLTSVIETIEGSYDAVQWYDNTDTRDPWKHKKIGKHIETDLLHLNETMGFWIHITRSGDTVFPYNGTQPTTNQTLALHPGWNMVGYPSLTSYNRTAGLNNLTFDTHVDAIWTYNAATQKYKQLTASDHFEIGKGYYIHAKAECIWLVPL